jgi:hypothetical protein
MDGKIPMMQKDVGGRRDFRVTLLLSIGLDRG